jgi:hypothetical protein
MRGYLVCPECQLIHGCVIFLNGTIHKTELCYLCETKNRECEADPERTNWELKQICVNCLIDSGLKSEN